MNFTFKPLTEKDLPLLYSWFKKPHVTKWWAVPLADENFFNDFLPRTRIKQTFPFLVFADDKPIGYLQYYYIDQTLPDTWLPELSKNTVGTDQFIGEEEYLGKGYGTQFIKVFLTYLTTALEPNITTVIVDPDPENVAAIKCYEKVGFTSIGIYKTPWGQVQVMRYEIASKY